MRKISRIKAGMAALLLACAAGARATPAPLGPGSRIWLEGKSTLHPFESQSRQFQIDWSAQPPAAQAPTLGAALQAQLPVNMTVTIPLASLVSEHSGLDKNLRNALGASKNPDIVFVLKGYRLAQDGGTAIVAWGDLSVAGQTKPQTLNAVLSWKDGRAVVDGQQPLLMTDFGVTPPTMMMGAVKTQDRVVVKFHVELEQGADGKREPNK